jgi:signal transduction histidine kinase/CheY-like chemotaxis protein/predicted hydrocarbon binding protein
MVCQSHHGSHTAITQRVHRLPPASVRDVTCMAEGDSWCELEITWAAPVRRTFLQAAFDRLFPHRAAFRRAAAGAGAPPAVSAAPAAAPVPPRAAVPPEEPRGADHTILERPYLAFRPFGVDEQGVKIRDVSGVSVRAMLDHLELYIEQERGKEPAQNAVRELCRLLNERIRDPVYHVTPAFLRNTWHSYSYEFVCYIYEFCRTLSGDSAFEYNAGKEKISPVIEILGRPFSVGQIYRMLPHFGRKYAQGSIEFEVGTVTDRAAILRIRFTDRVNRQFGPYRRRCAAMICQSFHGSLAAVPERVHGLPPALVTDRTCMAKGDDYCEWEVSWGSPSEDAAPERDGADAAITERISQTLQHRVQETARAAPPDGAAAVAPLSKEHTILERPFMEFRPFGIDEQGHKIRDVNGTIVHANIEWLRDCAARQGGQDAADASVAELCRLLNERIRDSAYHVTPAMLVNDWNGYSYEFVSYLREFAERLSGDPQYSFNVGRTRHISTFIQALGRPFTMQQLSKMWPYFAEKFAKGSVVCRVVEAGEHSARLALQFTDRSRAQFGPYARACARLTCEASKGALSAVPVRMHGQAPARVRDITCQVNGDEWCEWEMTWAAKPVGQRVLPLWGTAAGAAVFVYLRLMHPGVSAVEALLLGLLPPTIAWMATRRALADRGKHREALIQEQVEFLEARHEELREAYLEQEQTRVELRRKVHQLTTLHRTGLLFSATLDRKTLIHNVLETLVTDLHYDRAMLVFFDRVRRVSHDPYLLGVSPEVIAAARSEEIPVKDPSTVEGEVLLIGKPVLVREVAAVRHRMHPINQRLVELTGTKAFIAVPLKVKDMVIGSLTVDRVQENSLSEDDLELMVTLASQVAIALDNTEAYLQIEALNLGLEAKVRERTLELEKADRMRAQFLSHVSHELRTPLTSIKGFVENMLLGVAGALSDKQQGYLQRVGINADRLIRMISDLLDQTRIESGRLELMPTELDVVHAVSETLEQLRPLAMAKRQQLGLEMPPAPVMAWADADRLAQIVTNLVQNAIKFTPEEGRIDVRVTPGDPHFAHVIVRDTGPGIPADALARVFDPFFRVGAERSGPKGLGLGLSIVKTLVELHGGAIGVRSVPDAGAEFEFTLPVRPTAVAQTPPTAQAGRRILVVDDDPDIRDLLSDRLAAAGYVVDVASDGGTALRMLHEHAYGGLILDIGLPELGGLEVLRQYRERDRTTPIVMITASGSKQRALQAMTMGAQAYLLKPFDVEELQQVIESWFGKAGA